VLAGVHLGTAEDDAVDDDQRQIHAQRLIQAEGIRLQGGARERVRRPALLPRDTGLGAVCGMAGRKRQPQRQGLGRTGQGLRQQDYNAYRKDSIIKLTRKGVDLVEGTINDPGIDV